jgi:hypothetical protein
MSARRDGLVARRQVSDRYHGTYAHLKSECQGAKLKLIRRISW